MIRSLYAGSPKRRAIWSIARKNAKTTLGAAILLLHLVGPEMVPGTQLVSTSPKKKEQAAYAPGHGHRRIGIDSLGYGVVGAKVAARAFGDKAASVRAPRNTFRQAARVQGFCLSIGVGRLLGAVEGAEVLAPVLSGEAAGRGVLDAAGQLGLG